MVEIDEIIKLANLSLNDKLNQLEVLEEEKIQILLRYQKSSLQERKLIEKEMKESEERFKKLSEEVSALSEKVKKLKNLKQ